VLSEQDLIAIETRANKATLGPWAWDHTGVWTLNQGGVCGPVLDAPSPGDPADGIGVVGDDYPRGINHPSESMEFIAHARSDVPALLAEVRRQRKELEDWEEREAACCPEDVGFPEYIASLQKEIERLRWHAEKRPASEY
jgi:hypothetical protein